MKWTKNILILLSLFTFAVVELSAQSTSSAAQVVTFGVQRMGSQVSLASNVMNSSSHNLLKVTAGSESHVQLASEFSALALERILASTRFHQIAGSKRESPVGSPKETENSVSRSTIAKTDISFQSLVTLTE
jgi:hypothetical protein